jgi:CBS domain-containing protein
MRSRVQDVMTGEVLAVTPATPFKELVSLLTAYRISALPVVDAGRHVLGLVSEADLLAAQPQPETQIEPDPGAGEGWEDRAPIAPARHSADRVKASGQVAADFMHTPAVTIAATTSLNQAARLLQARNLKRLVVVGDDNRLVGIVTRSDLLKVFLRADDDIRREIIQELIVKGLFLDPDRFTVTVTDGVVSLGGTVERRGLVRLLVRLVAAVDGVVEVGEHLGGDVADRGGTAPRQPLPALTPTPPPRP